MSDFNPMVCQACRNSGIVATYHPAFVKLVLEGAKRVFGTYRFNREARNLIWRREMEETPRSKPHRKLRIGKPVEVPCKCSRGDVHSLWISTNGSKVRDIPRYRTHKLMVPWLFLTGETADDEIIEHIKDSVREYQASQVKEWEYA